MNTVLICKTLLEIGLTLLMQSAVIVGLALAAAKWQSRRGAAFQALILRSALAAVLLCGALSLSFSGYIHSLISLSLPAAQVQAISPVSSPPLAGMPVSTSSWELAQLTPVAHAIPSHSGAPALPPVTYAGSMIIETHTLPIAIAGFRLAWLYIGGAGLWVAGLMAFLIWLLACQFHLFLIARRSNRVTSGPAWDALQKLLPESAKRPRLLASSAVKSPFLAGFWRPTIFLPTDIDRYFDHEALLVVLAHEMCHLRRCDAVWVLFARLARILLWMQPLMWILERSLLEASEAICDAEVVHQGQVSASRYADCLVEMAERMAMPAAVRVVGLGVLPFRSSLGKRVQNVLSGARSFVQPITLALRIGVGVAAATLVLAGVLLVAARIPSRAAASGSSIHTGKGGECAQHLRLLSLAVLEYAQDHGEVYPDAARWSEEITYYVKDKSAFQDPLDPKGAPWGFAFNRNLSHVRIAKLPNPARTVLFFESAANKRDASDTGQSLAKPAGLNGGSYFAFADGHVMIIPQGTHPSFSITAGWRGAAAPKYQVYLAGDQPGQDQKVFIQIVDPNHKDQDASGFNVPTGSPYLGIQYAPASNFKSSPIIKVAPANVVQNGMVVVRAVPGGPAATAGIQKSDIIYEADGKSLAGKTMLLRKLIELHKPGERMRLTIYSQGKSRQTTMVVGKAPPAQEQAQADNKYQLQLVAIQLKQLQSQLAETTQELQRKKSWPDKERGFV